VRVTVLLAAAAALAAVGLGEQGAAPVWLIALAAGAGAAAGLLLHRWTRHREGDHTMWRWAGTAGWVLAAGLAVEALADVLGGPRGAGATLGACGAAAALYHGLVHWNRVRTAISDPGDWLNGISATVALVALGNLTVTGEPGTAAWWGTQLGLLRLAAVLVTLGTAGTAASIAGLGRDRRAWVLAAGLAAVAAVEGAALAGLLGPAARGTVAPSAAVVAAWGALLLLTAALRVGRARALPPVEASSQATTVGAVVVLVGAVLVLVADALLPGHRPAAAVLAAVALVGGGARVLRLVSELAQLASVRQEARTDPLTGVANRRALVEAVADLASAPRAALLVVDLDRFKEVNDRFGHAVGDGVIRTVAARLEGALGGEGLLARLGGDEFAAVLRDAGAQRATAVAEVLLAVVNRPVQAEGRAVRLEASIGVASTELGARAGELLRCADTAMYAAKAAGGGVRLYDEDSDARAVADRELRDALRAALEGRAPARDGRVVVHLQPQIDLADGRVVGAEALVRWDHPERGVLPPAAFLELAEQHGLMTPLTWHVLDQATRAAAAWTAAGHDLRVAVNLSTSCLEHPGLLEMVDDALARSGLPADRLVLEITETSLMHHPETAVEVTRRFAARGIGISIDDYGTGYSSLAYLNDLPAEELKLDRSFTARAAADPRTRAIVSGTVDLAHHLGLRLIAEGVEDEGTHVLLRELGCDRVQGYLHGRPVPAGEFARWLEDGRDGRAAGLADRADPLAPSPA
jgi:diguanylate cyclase (GGDEF)-like protein